MKFGTRMLLMKYGKTPYNCIELHINEVEKRGFCWFGKIGTPPSMSMIRKKIGEGTIKILLYCQNEIYLCNCSDIKKEKPEIGYPEYYEKYLFGRGIIPKIYFRLDTIKRIEKTDLTNCVVLSSRNSMLEAVSHSMASFFYVEYAAPEERTVENKKTRQRKMIEEKRIREININDCLYRKEGICTNKRCISYEYECTRPSSCIKQKLM